MKFTQPIFFKRGLSASLIIFTGIGIQPAYQSAYADTPHAKKVEKIEYIGQSRDWIIRTSGKNPNAPAAKENDCLILANNGSDKFPSRFAWGTAAGQQYCGFPDAPAVRNNKQAMWNIRDYIVVFTYDDNTTKNRSVSVIRSGFSDDCLALFDPNNPQSSPYMLPCSSEPLENVNNPQLLWDLAGMGASKNNPIPIRSYQTDQCLIFGNGGSNIKSEFHRWSDYPGPQSIQSCGIQNLQSLQLTGQATFSFELLP
jgi:hypothetical protein